MRKLLSALVLMTFALVMQMPFIHALDMGMNDDMSTMSPVHMPEGHGVLCDKNNSSSSRSCSSDIPESKWVEGVKRIGIIGLIPVVLTVLFSWLYFRAFGSYSEFFKHRILYHATLYLGLYGIIRNVN